LTYKVVPYLKSVPESLNEVGRDHSRYIELHTLLLTNSGATLGVPKISLIGGCINDGVPALLEVDYPLKLYLLYFLRTQTDRLRGVNQGAAGPTSPAGRANADRGGSGAAVERGGGVGAGGSSIQ